MSASFVSAPRPDKTCVQYARFRERLSCKIAIQPEISCVTLRRISGAVGTTHCEWCGGDCPSGRSVKPTTSRLLVHNRVRIALSAALRPCGSRTRGSSLGAYSSTRVEEAKSVVPESSQDSSSSGFGANEWLVDEMYEKYQQDPSSVDKVWWDFFGKDQPTDPARQSTQRPDQRLAGQRHHADQGQGVDRRPQGTPAQAKDAAEQKSTPMKTETKTEPKSEEKSEDKSEEVRAARGQKTEKKTDDEGREEVQASRTSEAGARPRRRRGGQPTTSRPTRSCAGAPARTVSNMDASLSVPTATSVRSVPVKLLWDNRIVINNHLARARGGKVSFTHIIGYALVKALKSMPEMNVGLRGQGQQAEPDHAGPHQPRAWPSTCPRTTAPGSCSCRASRPRRRWTSRTSGPPTRTSSARRATASSRSPTSPVRRSA